MHKKTLIISGLLIFAVFLTACGSIASSPQITTARAASGDDAQLRRTLSVNGSGQVTLTPDIAYVTVGVQTEGKDASKAVAENNTQTQKVIDALVKGGVDSKDIKTTNFNIFPRQEYDNNGKPTGEITYVVNNSVYVTVRDLEMIGDLLNAVVLAGANSVQGIQFDVENKTEAYAQAQEKAVANAKAQAENLASAAGVTLGQVITINTYGGATPLPKYDRSGGVVLAESAPVPVSPGEMKISVDVNMVYEIK